jgi:hypothetical protein
MDGIHKNGESERVRMELKYCEHCGGLWLRECGTGVVYCPNCEPRVADLPAAKKKPGRVTLPEGRRTVVEDYGPGVADPEEGDVEAAGGAA